MSTHFEFHDAEFTTVTPAFPGEVVGADEMEPGQYGLLFASNEVSAVYGTVAELEQVVIRIHQAIRKIKEHRDDTVLVAKAEKERES